SPSRRAPGGMTIFPAERTGVDTHAVTDSPPSADLAITFVNVASITVAAGSTTRWAAAGANSAASSAALTRYDQKTDMTTVISAMAIAKRVILRMDFVHLNFPARKGHCL